jgi:dTDP-4-dehydrorhamnose 3,5-epimerase-like enzyme
MLYIPAGLAHGYLTLQEGTIVNYLHGEIYSEKDERGIAYDSFGMDWRITEPVLSAKDSRLCAFRDFISPF